MHSRNNLLILAYNFRIGWHDNVKNICEIIENDKNIGEEEMDLYQNENDDNFDGIVIFLKTITEINNKNEKELFDLIHPTNQIEEKDSDRGPN